MHTTLHYTALLVGRYKRQIAFSTVKGFDSSLCNIKALTVSSDFYLGKTIEESVVISSLTSFSTHWALSEQGCTVHQRSKYFDAAYSYYVNPVN